MTSQRKPFGTCTKIILALALALVLPALGLLSVEVHEANLGFKTFANALVQKDYDKAYMLATPEFQSVVSKEKFENQQLLLRSKLGDIVAIRQESFDTARRDGVWWSDIGAHFTFQRGERDFSYKMKKQGSTWLIYGYKEN